MSGPRRAPPPARRAAEAVRHRRELHAARCSACGCGDGLERPLLPLAGGWSCGGCLRELYDAVLAGLPPPEPPSVQLEAPVPSLRGRPVQPGSRPRRVGAP